MKRNLMLMFLFLSALMLSSVGNVSNASSLGNYYCNAIPLSNTHVDCLRSLLHQHAPQEGQPGGGRGGLGYYSCDRPDHNTWRHINCLRAKLDQWAPGLAVRQGSQNTQPRHHMGSNGMAAPLTYDDSLMGAQPNRNVQPIYPR